MSDNLKKYVVTITIQCKDEPTWLVDYCKDILEYDPNNPYTVENEKILRCTIARI